jgi:carbonic anhydrase
MMRLFEAIVAANHRAVAGDNSAGLHPAEFADSLPIIALTCIDPRLNALMPAVLGIPEEQFIWLRNAGNIIFDPMSSMMRTLALACAVKGGREIAIIGHTDCRVGKTTMVDLIGRFHALGVDRSRLPENLNEFFGLFASERQNVIKGVDFVRSSPLIGPRVPVHGFLVDIQTGKLEWLTNGYQVLATATAQTSHEHKPLGQTIAGASPLAAFHMGEMKFPESRIGAGNLSPQDWMGQVEIVEKPQLEIPNKLKLRPEEPPQIPVPPRIRSAPKPTRPARAWKKD